MNISSLVDMVKDVEVINDSEFNALGMATSAYIDKKVLTFLSDVKYLSSVINNKCIKAVICNRETYDTVNIPKHLGVLLSENPMDAFFNIHNKLSKMEFYWSKFKNTLSASAQISKDVILGEHSIKIGVGSIIEPGVIIHPGTIIGSNVIVRSGSQIGTNGFQFINNGSDVFSVITGGRVVIGEHAEIQHNCCVDRGVLGGDTKLGRYVKLDNFIHVAHDVVIGDRTFITAGVKIAGRVNIGKDCWVGVNATISNGLSIGDNSRISIGSVVTQDVEPHSIVTGNFAIEHNKFIEFIKTIR